MFFEVTKLSLFCDVKQQKIFKMPQSEETYDALKSHIRKINSKTHRRLDAEGFDTRCNSGKDYHVPYLYKTKPFITRPKNLISSYVSGKAQFTIIKLFTFAEKKHVLKVMRTQLPSGP